MIITPNDYIGCRKDTKILLNGVDVTKNCFYVNTDKGIVQTYVRDCMGYLIMDSSGHEIKKRRQKGKVVVTIGREILL
jgi:hypothetical protein